MLTKNDSISLEAFLTAFMHLDQPLDESTEQALIQVIESLKILANNSPMLKEQYDRKRIELLKNYQSQPRNKLIHFSTQSTVEQPLPDVQVKHSILELEGLGQEIWQGIDAQQYVDQERDSWNG